MGGVKNPEIQYAALLLAPITSKGKVFILTFSVQMMTPLHSPPPGE